MNKKIITVFLTLTLIVTSVSSALPVQAKARKVMPKLSNKQITMTLGKTKTVKLKYVSRKVTWKVLKGKKVIKITKKSGKYKNVINIKGRKSGNAVIKATYKKKTYKIKVKVKPVTPKKDQTVTPEETTTAIQYATITFVTNGGTKVDSMKIKIGEPYGKLPVTEKKDYVFGLWTTEYYGGKHIYETDICTGDITLYARFFSIAGDLPAPGEYTPSAQYATVTFESNVGCKVDSMKIKIGEPYGKLPVAEKEGYVFAFWTTEYYGGKHIYETDICTGDTTLYAWLISIGGCLPAPEEEGNK